jgi:tetratricopeptide (TPR) repeat protein
MTLEFIFIFLLLSSVQSSAQEDNNENQITGESEVKSRTTELDLTEVPEPILNELQELIGSYEENIKSLRFKLAPYDSGLAEQTHSLGLMYQEDGNHEQAIKLLKETLLINRINIGLYNVGHLEIIYKLILSYGRLKDWENVNNMFEYIYWLHNRNLDKYDFEWLPFLKNYYRWNWRAYYVDTGETREHHEWRRRRTYDRISEIIEKFTGSNELTDCFIVERNNDGICTIQVIQLRNKIIEE